MGKDGGNDNRAKCFVQSQGMGVGAAVIWRAACVDLKRPFPYRRANPHRPSQLDGCHIVLRKQSQLRGTGRKRGLMS